MRCRRCRAEQAAAPAPHISRAPCLKETLRNAASFHLPLRRPPLTAASRALTADSASAPALSARAALAAPEPRCLGPPQMDCFKDLPLEKTRSAVGRFGITGKAQTQPIRNLSDGLRSRVVFAKLAYETPNMARSRPPAPPGSHAAACKGRAGCWQGLSLFLGQHPRSALQPRLEQVSQAVLLASVPARQLSCSLPAASACP